MVEVTFDDTASVKRTTIETPIEADDSSAPIKRPSLLNPLRVGNFRLLWIGESISLLGDQFYMVALPWLVLQLTGSGLAAGTVLGVAGIPRAALMLVGGALTDRFSPRSLMFASNAGRIVLTALLTGLVITHTIQLWMLYVLAFAFGIADAFFLPAQSAILPRLIKKDDLDAGNAITQITAQLSTIVGPVLAGVIIATLTGSAAQEASADTRGISISFGFDTLTFVVATLALWLMNPQHMITPESGEVKPKNSSGIFGSIIEGLRIAWTDPTLRVTLILVAGLNVLFSGPMGVGIPVLANGRFAEGAAAFGIILAAFGVGAFIGAVLAGSLPRPKYFGIVSMFLMGGSGLGMALLGFATSLPIAAVITLGMGLMVGYVNVVMSAWLQKRTDPAVMGRVMSLVMLAAFGLQPISNMIAGALVDINPAILFAGAGLSIALLSVWGALNPVVQHME